MPADGGFKSGREYVRQLVKEGVFKVGDLKVFTIDGVTPATSLETITADHIGFRIANVSEKDPPETIFIVTPNFVNNTPHFSFRPLHWWERFWPGTARQIGFVVFRKGGDGSFFTHPPDKVSSEAIGILPPREPKFLAP